MPSHATVVFLHAHPDDEAIFTGGSMRLLADAGHRVVLVVATGGEGGLAPATASTPIRDRELSRHRGGETIRAADLLGVDTVVFAGFVDSGMHAERPGGFAHTDPATAADVIADLLGSVDAGRPDALVSYDTAGIYGHPDHVAVHRVGRALADLLRVPTGYEATVDREYLHFVETHLVVEAGVPDRPAGLGLAATSLGLSTVEIDLTVDVNEVLGTKRAAMAAHESQIPATSSALALAAADFSAVYGFEWYRRSGPPGALDLIG